MLEFLNFLKDNKFHLHKDGYYYSTLAKYHKPPYHTIIKYTPEQLIELFEKSK